MLLKDYFKDFFKGAAIAGISLIWFDLTVEALKMAWHVISSSPEEGTCKVDPFPEKFQEPFYDELEE